MPISHHCLSTTFHYEETIPSCASLSFAPCPLFLPPKMSMKTSLLPSAQKKISQWTVSSVGTPSIQDLVFGGIAVGRFIVFNRFRWLVGLTPGQRISVALLHWSVQNILSQNLGVDHVSLRCVCPKEKTSEFPRLGLENKRCFEGCKFKFSGRL